MPSSVPVGKDPDPLHSGYILLSCSTVLLTDSLALAGLKVIAIPLLYIVHGDPIFFPSNPIFCPSHLLGKVDYLKNTLNSAITVLSRLNLVKFSE